MIVTSSFLCFLLKHELQIGFARSDEKYIHEPHMKYDLEARLRIDRAQGLHKLMLHVLHRVISSNEVSFLQREHCNSPAAGMLELLPRKDLNVLRTPPISGTPYRLRPGLRSACVQVRTGQAFLTQQGYYLRTGGTVMLRPFITVEKRAHEALAFYESVFSSYALISMEHHAEPHHELVMLAVFSVKGQEIMISDSFVEHEWDITPGVSFFIETDDEDELRSLASSLSKGGNIHMPAGNYGFSRLFCWVEDNFGINWQLNLR